MATMTQTMSKTMGESMIEAIVPTTFRATTQATIAATFEDTTPATRPVGTEALPDASSAGLLPKNRPAARNDAGSLELNALVWLYFVSTTFRMAWACA
jgi:hypothetical protein